MSGMGRAFERLMQAALSQEPGILGDRFTKVWMWDEWPGRDGQDAGIDLVAEERDGGLCAIQCKFFDPHRRLAWRPNGGGSLSWPAKTPSSSANTHSFMG